MSSYNYDYSSNLWNYTDDEKPGNRSQSSIRSRSSSPPPQAQIEEASSSQPIVFETKKDTGFELYTELAREAGISYARFKETKKKQYDRKNCALYNNELEDITKAIMEKRNFSEEQFEACKQATKNFLESKGHHFHNK